MNGTIARVWEVGCDNSRTLWPLSAIETEGSPEGTHCLCPSRYNWLGLERLAVWPGFWLD